MYVVYNVRYTMFWVLLIITKLAFSYYIEVMISVRSSVYFKIYKFYFF